MRDGGSTLGSSPFRMGAWLPGGLAWLGLVLSLVLLYLRLSAEDPSIVWRVWLSSDTLYPVNVFTDVFHDGYGISGWRFSIAPCWFPDLVATGLFLALTGNVVLATLLAGFIQIVALVLLFKAFRVALGLPRQGAMGPILLLVAVLLTIFVANHAGLTDVDVFQLFLPQSHVGSVCVALGGLALGIAIARREGEGRSAGWTMVGGYVVLCVLGGMSNLLFLPNALVPLTIVAVAFVLLRLMPRRAGALLLLGWPAAVVGIFLNRTLFRVTDLAAQAGSSRARIRTALVVFTRGFFSNLLSGEPLHLAAVLWAVVCLVVGWLALRSALASRSEDQRRTQSLAAMLFLCLFLSSAAGCAAIVLGGSNGLAVFKDYRWSMHYLHPTFLVPLFGLPAVGAWWLQRARPRAVRWVGTASSVAACALPVYALAGTKPPATLLQAQVPPMTQFMDELAAREHLRTGFAGYWQARPITLFSRTGLRAYAVDGSMTPLLWVSNLQWYQQLRRADGKGFDVDFVVLDDPLWKLSREAAVSVFGEPRREVRFGGTRVLIYGGRQEAPSPVPGPVPVEVPTEARPVPSR